MSFGNPNFPEKGQPIVIDLFSGAGGLSLGFARSGYKIGIAVDYDKYVAETYSNNIPNIDFIQAKIENVDGDKLLDIVSRRPSAKLILVAGPPCQPFSQANLQNNGAKHPSASVIDHFVRLLEETNPDAFLFENVVSFKWINKGKAMHELLKSLKSLKYQLSIAELNSEEFGVPQRRSRIYIGGIKSAGQEFDLTTVRRSRARPTIKDAISDLPTLQEGGGGFNVVGYPESKKVTNYQRKARDYCRMLYNHWCTKNSSEVIETIRYISPGSNLKKAWDQLPKSVKARYKNPDNIHYNVYRRLAWDLPSITIVHPRRAMLLHPSCNRIITVREAARIQSFPDWFRFHGGIDSQYQQVANAVPPRVADSLAHFYAIHLETPTVRTNTLIA